MRSPHGSLLLFVLGFSLAALALAWLVPPYFLYLLALAGAWGIAALGLNLLVGYTGLISIGHGGFMAMGGYAYALALLGGWPFPLALFLAAFVGAVAGLLLGFPALRLTGPYLAIATLGFNAAVGQVLLRWQNLTGGYQGLRLPGFSLEWLLVAVFLLLGISLWIKTNLVRSAVGQALVAVRGNEPAALAVGISLVWAKTGAFALSALYAAVAGALMAQVAGLVTPFDFGLWASIFLLAMVIVGGLGSLYGPLLGALLLFWGHQLLSGLPDLRNLVFGGLLILFPLFWSQGVWRIFGSWGFGLGGRKA